MKFEIHTSLLEKARIDFNQFLYNSPSFLKASNDLPIRHFYLMNQSTGSYEAHVVFSEYEDSAVSPYRAPFGGIEVAEDLNDEGLQYFIDSIFIDLRVQNINQVRIHQAPSNYQSKEAINVALELGGCELIQERIYHGIIIDQTPLEEKIADMQQRRLRKAHKAGFQFKHFEKSELANAFKQIDRWRNLAQKGLSMTWADLHNSSTRNPKRYHAFGVMDGDVMIAGTIVVEVNEKVLYHFFPASYDAYNQFSPMVMLIDGIYGWGQENGFEHIDLGTSYIDEKENTSLKIFKERMAGKPYIAKSWRKKLK